MKRDLLLALTTSVLFSLAFPPLRLGFLAYIALVPLFILLAEKNYRQAIRWGFITGFFMNLGTLYWISWVTVPGAIAAILYLPIYTVIYALLHTLLRQRLPEKYFYWCVPFLWTGVEYLRSLGVLGFPWSSLAYTQTYYLSLIQYVSFTSVYGVSLWVATINVVIWLLWQSTSRSKKLLLLFITLLLIFIIPWIYGQLVLPDPSKVNEEKIRVGLIQGNIDPFLKWDDAFLQENLMIYDRLSREAAQQQPQLLIWPETAVPDYLRISSLYLNGIRKLLADIHTPLITGAPDFEYQADQSYLAYNAVFLLTPAQDSLPCYRKMHLVPFGERVPFTESFPFLKDFLERLEMGEGNFSPGNKVVSFTVPILDNEHSGATQMSLRHHILAPVVICFESLFPEIVRQFIQNGADILIIVTNDAWFKRSAAPFHHAQVAIFRAIENRISIARCANTGVSMFIDPYGRTIQATSIFETAVAVNDLPLRRKTT
ncbi:MAG: apolipoprotein N-acyltransferase, partial [candidate division KSB1 bacterium]|nr:apolipoprotein N-acyltransferase [candidate division KSB1 bacterium]